MTVGRNPGAGMVIAGPASVQASIVASNTGPACAQALSGVSASVASDASCGFGVVADPGLSANLVDTGGEFASYVPEVLTIPAGSPAEDIVAPCAFPFDQRFGERFTVAGAPCDAGAYERVASGAVAQPRVETPTPTPPPAQTPTPTPTPEPTPEFRETVVVEPVRGTVLVCPQRPTRCAPLRAGQTIPMGSTVDTRKGRVELTSLSSDGGPPQTAQFYDGIFRVTQSGAYTELTLTEPLAPCSNRARASQSKKPKARKLWGDGKGKFRTKGRYAAATVRGTRWLTQDSCAGTLIRVTQGVVSVRDTVLRKTVTVRKGKRYLAKPRR